MITQENSVTKKKTQSPSWRLEFVQDHLEKWQASNLSLPQYRREQGVPYARLAWWRNKLLGSMKSRRAAASPVLPLRFVPVDLMSSEKVANAKQSLQVVENTAIKVMSPGVTRWWLGRTSMQKRWSGSLALLVHHAEFPSVHIFLAKMPVDMRKSYDALEHLVRGEPCEDPMSGHLYHQDSHMLDLTLPALKHLRLRQEKLACNDHPEAGVAVALPLHDNSIKHCPRRYC